MPTSPVDGTLLWARAAVLSVFGLAVGAVAHVQADGLLPGAGVLVALVACGTLLTAPLLRRTASTRRVVGLLVAGQSTVHGVLAATAGHRGDPAGRPVRSVSTSVSPHVTSGQRRGSYYDVAYSSGAGDHAGGLGVPAPLVHAVTDLTAHPLMAVAHLFAAAACGWWLARGERALLLLLTLTSRGWTELVAPALGRWAVVGRALVASARSVELLVLTVGVVDPLPQSQVRSRSESRRGPPLAG